jgi:predicted RNA methylase
MIGLLKPGEDDVLVDIGCGKGRVALMFARERLKGVEGIEADPALYRAAQDNLAAAAGLRTPVRFWNCDVSDADLGRGTIYYLFDPAGCRTTGRIVDLLRESFQRAPRRLRIVYFQPSHYALLDAQDWLEKESSGAALNGARYAIWRSRTAR